MDEKTMFQLLEIYDARENLETVQEMLTGCIQHAGYGEGILGNLSYVTDIIMRYSPLYDPAVNYEDSEFGRILEDDTMDNNMKARILLGIRD